MFHTSSESNHSDPIGRTAQTLARFLALAALAASSSAFAATESNPDLAARLSAAVPKGVTLVVAEQSDQASTPWRLSGVGKTAPYDIKFANFNGGPAVLESLVSGATDIGYIGEAPLPIALSAGVQDLVAIAVIANPGSPGNIFLVVQPNSGIKSVKELAGRSIAYPPGTGRNMILAGILHTAGLNIRKDIKGVQLAGSEVAPTFASGAVDGAIVLGQQYFRLGKPPILEDGTGHNWGLNVIVVRKELLSDPAKRAAIADFTRRAVAFNNWQAAHPDEWIKASYVKQQGLTFEQGKFLLEKSGQGTYYPINKELVNVFQQISDGLFETGALTKKVSIEPYIDNRFNDIIEAQNESDGVKPRPLINEVHRAGQS